MKGLACLGILLILFPAFGWGDEAAAGLFRIKNRYGCTQGTYSYSTCCNSNIFLWNEAVTAEGEFMVVLQELRGPIRDVSRDLWDLVPTDKPNQFKVRLCGSCHYGPCCLYWSMKRYWTWSELVGSWTDKNDLFEFEKDKNGDYFIRYCKENRQCPYQLTWEYLSGTPQVKWLSAQHFRSEGVTFRLERVRGPVPGTGHGGGSSDSHEWDD